VSEIYASENFIEHKITPLLVGIAEGFGSPAK
jgi:hypothetical protein